MSRHQHWHLCIRECGRGFTCDIELCAGEWVCPNCDDAEREDYINQLAIEAEQQQQRMNTKTPTQTLQETR